MTKNTNVTEPMSAKVALMLKYFSKKTHTRHSIHTSMAMEPAFRSDSVLQNLVVNGLIELSGRIFQNYDNTPQVRMVNNYAITAKGIDWLAQYEIKNGKVETSQDVAEAANDVEKAITAIDVCGVTVPVTRQNVISTLQIVVLKAYVEMEYLNPVEYAVLNKNYFSKHIYNSPVFYQVASQVASYQDFFNSWKLAGLTFEWDFELSSFKVVETDELQDAYREACKLYDRVDVKALCNEINKCGGVWVLDNEAYLKNLSHQYRFTTDDQSEKKTEVSSVNEFNPLNFGDMKWEPEKVTPSPIVREKATTEVSTDGDSSDTDEAHERRSYVPNAPFSISVNANMEQIAQEASAKEKGTVTLFGMEVDKNECVELLQSAFVCLIKRFKYPILSESVVFDMDQMFNIMAEYGCVGVEGAAIYHNYKASLLTCLCNRTLIGCVTVKTTRIANAKYNFAIDVDGVFNEAVIEHEQVLNSKGAFKSNSEFMKMVDAIERQCVTENVKKSGDESEREYVNEFIGHPTSSIEDYIGGHLPLVHICMAYGTLISGFVNKKTFKLYTTEDMLVAVPEMKPYFERSDDGNYELSQKGNIFAQRHIFNIDAAIGVDLSMFMKVVN